MIVLSSPQSRAGEGDGGPAEGFRAAGRHSAEGGQKAGQRHGEPEARVGHAIKGRQNVCDQARVLAPYTGSMDRATLAKVRRVRTPA